MSSKTYYIVRMFRDVNKRMVIKSGLTLEEAQEHCKDPETSSSTASGTAERLLTQRFGPWFDGYEEEA